MVSKTHDFDSCLTFSVAVDRGISVARVQLGTPSGSRTRTNWLVLSFHRHVLNFEEIYIILAKKWGFFKYLTLFHGVTH